MRGGLVALTVAAVLIATPSVGAASAAGVEYDDLTPPVVTITRPAGGHHGWYPDTVSVGVKATDDHVSASGVASIRWWLQGAAVGTGTLPAGTGGAVTIADEGLSTLSVTALDRAGNDGVAQASIGIDRSAPTIALGGRLATETVFAQHEQVWLNYVCADALSGVATCTGPTSAVDTSVLGEHTTTVEAVDNVGRVHRESRTYTVVTGDIDVVTGTTVSGIAQVGHTLTGTAAVFSPTPSVVTTQWHRDGHPIPGATGLAYAPQAADVGRQVTLVTTATRSGWTDRASASSPVLVAAGELALDQPVLKGSAVFGGILEVKHSEVEPAGATVRYTWFRGQAPVPGANRSTYQLSDADLGHRITATVTADLAGYESLSRTTAPSEVVRGSQWVADGLPVLTGSARAGSTLHVTAPGFTKVVNLRAGEEPVATVRWLRDGQPTMVTGASYRLGAADVGHRISATVTASASGYEPLTVVSPATRPVAKAVPVVRATAPRKKRRVTLMTVRVGASGLVPTGKVLVKRGPRVLGRGTLRSGKVRIRLTGVPRGRSRLAIRYQGDAAVAPRVVKRKVVLR